MFSEAISSIWSRWRWSSWPIAAASSGSAAASGAVKKRSGLASEAAVLRVGMRGPDVVKRAKARSRHLGDAPRVAPAFEFGGEERLDAILGDFGAEDAAAEHEDVGVVVLAREPGAGAVMDERGADRAMAVGGDRHADAGAAAHHASRRPPLADGAGERRREVRIVDGIAAHRAGIEHLVS